MDGPLPPEFSEIYDSIPKDFMSKQMMVYPFNKCGVWQAFDVPARCFTEARTCMRLWEKHARQGWEFSKKPNFIYQFRRIM